MKHKPTDRTILYSLSNSSETLAEGVINIVSGKPTLLSPDDGNVRVNRGDFASFLHYWRKTDPSARRTPADERIGAMILFALRKGIHQIENRQLPHHS